MSSSSLDLRTLRVGLLLAGLLAGGCQVAVRPAEAPVTQPADVRAGAYVEDPRWPAFARAWPARVRAAFERLAVLTGLEFEEGGRPRVVLRPFGDETAEHELRTKVVDGLRRTVVHVNAEPLLGGVRDPDRVLLRALTRAAFEEASRRHGPVPAWFIAMAQTAAAGDLDTRLLALRRRAFDGAETVVDDGDPAAADATGVAALLLLAERGQPQDVRRLLRFVAEGDSAPTALGRLVGEPGGRWVRPARLLLAARLAAQDTTPWMRLAQAHEAAREAGRAGLRLMIRNGVPAEIEDEVRVLQAAAAADEGDYEEARTLLASLGESAPARLQDPAAALALRVRVELQPGGDDRLARTLAGRLERDHPRSPARAELRRAHPLLGMQEDPQSWLVGMRTHMEAEGASQFDLGTLQRYVRTLLLDHRAGAAARFLQQLAERGEAPEFEELRAVIADAQGDPSEATLDRNRQRVTAWVAAPSPATERDVRDGGAAARPALLAVIAHDAPSRRAAAVALLAGALGDAAAVEAVRSLWRLDGARVRADLEALAAVVPYPALCGVRAEAGLDAETLRQVSSAWADLTFDLSEAWLTAHPTFLQDARHAEFARRREAFRNIAAQDPSEATPALVAHGLRDAAALLRREAVDLAGRTGFAALARRSLADDAWLVRAEGARAVARIEGRAAVPTLVRILRSDESRDVRAAAAQGLLAAAPQDERVLDALLATQVGEEGRLRDAIATRLAELPPLPVVRAILRGWTRALQRETADRGYLFRTALLYQRVTGQDLGYFPGAEVPELERMHARMRTWLAAREGAAGRVPDGGGRRRPTGRSP